MLVLLLFLILVIETATFVTVAVAWFFVLVDGYDNAILFIFGDIDVDDDDVASIGTVVVGRGRKERRRIRRFT